MGRCPLDPGHSTHRDFQSSSLSERHSGTAGICGMRLLDHHCGWRRRSSLLGSLVRRLRLSVCLEITGPITGNRSLTFAALKAYRRLTRLFPDRLLSSAARCRAAPFCLSRFNSEPANGGSLRMSARFLRGFRETEIGSSGRDLPRRARTPCTISS
jgi:hypothetical protein